MAVISGFSTDGFASSETSRYLRPLLEWLFPGVSIDTLDLLHAAIRKVMHIAEFAVLGFLWYRSLAWGQPSWGARPALGAMALAVLCAGLDEAHQVYVPERGPSVFDVGWDGLGALVGIVGTRVLGNRASSAGTASVSGKEAPRNSTSLFRD
jgi:VanZ family protein